MLTQFNSRTFAMALLAIFGFSLTACDQLAAQIGPNHQYILEVDSENAAAYAAEEVDIGPIVEASIPIITGRLEAMGWSVSSAERAGSEQIVLIVSGENSRGAVGTAIGHSAKLDFKLVDQAVLMSDVMQGLSSPGSVILPMADGSGQIAVRQRGGISGRFVVDAQAMFEPSIGQPAIAIRFDQTGTRKLAALSTANVGRPMAIILDGEVISAPIINEPILGGSLQLTGNFTEENSNEIAIMLRSGTLPTPFIIVEERKLD